MTYTSTQREARYRIAADQQGAFITKWYREVRLSKDGTIDTTTFEAYCTDDPTEPQCELLWTPAVSPDGKLIEKYTCTNVGCEGPDGCILQYSRDGEEWMDVTDDGPAETENCYFRCRCGGG